MPVISKPPDIYITEKYKFVVWLLGVISDTYGAWEMRTKRQNMMTASALEVFQALSGRLFDPHQGSIYNFHTRPQTDLSSF